VIGSRFADHGHSESWAIGQAQICNKLKAVQIVVCCSVVRQCQQIPWAAVLVSKTIVHSRNKRQSRPCQVCTRESTVVDTGIERTVSSRLYIFAHNNLRIILT
jgi:hypothetical protein